MGWLIGRTAVVDKPEEARAKAIAKLHSLSLTDDPEALIVPILVDAILMVEAHRGARHPFTQLTELTKSVDGLLRELNIVETTELMAAE